MLQLTEALLWCNRRKSNRRYAPLGEKDVGCTLISSPANSSKEPDGGAVEKIEQGRESRRVAKEYTVVERHMPLFFLSQKLDYSTSIIVTALSTKERRSKQV
ncbi:hypothetical protein PAXRUDRAFT_825333, partial [Paxillus rubicundulus Ve08.2h10]